MTKDEALKLALEALLRSSKAVSGDYDLASCAYGSNDPDGNRYQDAKKAKETLKQAITALKEALAQLEQEPVATVIKKGATMKRPLEQDYTSLTAYTRALEEYCDVLAHPKQEPVAWLMYKGTHKESFWLDKRDAYNFEMRPEHRWESLYTTPPQRTWVGLTQDERINIAHKANGNDVVAVELTEAKLKEKNT